MSIRLDHDDTAYVRGGAPRKDLEMPDANDAQPDTRTTDLWPAKRRRADELATPVPNGRESVTPRPRTLDPDGSSDLWPGGVLPSPDPSSERVPRPVTGAVSAPTYPPEPAPPQPASPRPVAPSPWVAPIQPEVEPRPIPRDQAPAPPVQPGPSESHWGGEYPSAPPRLGAPIPTPPTNNALYYPVSAKPPWGFVDLLLTVLVGAVFTVIFGVGYFGVIWLANLTLSDVTLFSVLATGVYLAFLLAIWVMIVLRKNVPWRLLGFRSTRPAVLLGMVPLAIVLLVVNILILIPFATRILGEDPGDGQDNVLAQAGLSLSDIILIAIPVVIAAPIVEEILFRGLLYPYLRGRFGSGWWRTAAAVVVSALLFGVLHIVVLPIFVMGVVLALLAERSRGIVPGIVLHAVNNGLVVLAIAMVNAAGVAG